MFLQTRLPNKTCHSNHHVTQHLLHAHTKNFLGNCYHHLLDSTICSGGRGRRRRWGGWRRKGSSDLKSQEERVSGQRYIGKTIFCGFHRDLEVAQRQSTRLKQAIEHQQEALCPCSPPTSLTIGSPSLRALCLG